MSEIITRYYIGLADRLNDINPENIRLHKDNICQELIGCLKNGFINNAELIEIEEHLGDGPIVFHGDGNQAPYQSASWKN